MFCVKIHSLGASELKMTKRIVISLQIELCSDQSVFRLKQESRNMEVAREFYLGTRKLSVHWLTVKLGKLGVGNVGHLLPHRRLVNAFTSCCLNILFVLPASKRNSFLKLIVARFLFGKIR